MNVQEIIRDTSLKDVSRLAPHYGVFVEPKSGVKSGLKSGE